MVVAMAQNIVIMLSFVRSICRTSNPTERYGQYETMDIDSEINAPLDILAEFCTQVNKENGTGFDIHFNEQPTESEVEIIKKQLVNWNNLNDFNTRLFKIFPMY